MGILIGYRGETLDSLQYLISLVINKDNEEEYKRVILDTQNYRAKREETLQRLAKKIARKVKMYSKPVKLEPMNPYERRIIHSALQSDKFVDTHSEGEEPYRRVVIELKKESLKGFLFLILRCFSNIIEKYIFKQDIIHIFKFIH